MKKILLLLLCLLLTSCGEEKSEDYLATPHELYVTFSQGDTEIDGRLELSPSGIAFYPDEPEGMSVIINGGGCEVSYGGLVFGDTVAEFVRLMPLYTEMTEGSPEIIFDSKGKPVSIQGKGYKINIHKEICK